MRPFKALCWRLALKTINNLGFFIIDFTVRSLKSIFNWQAFESKTFGVPWKDSININASLNYSHRLYLILNGKRHGRSFQW